MDLTVDNLSFSYGQGEVLHNISFSLKKGQFMSVLGPNGSGKSTLFRCILGNLPYYSGKVNIGDKEIRSISHRERAAAIAYIPQIHRPTFGYSVLDVVLMGTGRMVGTLSMPKKEQEDMAMEALCRVGAEHLKDRDFTKLSGGEQQLVLIARALAQRSHFFVMDEPTSVLDYGNQFRILSLVRGLADDGYGVLISTHNPQHALSYADSVLALNAGSIVGLGKPSEMIDSQMMRALYNIDVEIVSSSAGEVIVPKDLLHVAGSDPASRELVTAADAGSVSEERVTAADAGPVSKGGGRP